MKKPFHNDALVYCYWCDDNIEICLSRGHVTAVNCEHLDGIICNSDEKPEDRKRCYVIYHGECTPDGE
jgi:hypothetical protein